MNKIEAKELADLMRRGAKISEPCQGVFYDYGPATDASASGIRTCAVGAMALACTGHAKDAVGITERATGITLSGVAVIHHSGDEKEIAPHVGWYNGPGRGLLSAIFALNDDYGWTREAIADWLERQYVEENR